MIELDLESLLVHAKGTERLADLEATLNSRDLTLDLERPPDLTLAAWLEAGAEGARSAWLDPADHLVAGITTSAFSIKPVPRRAVGPDLLSIVLGTSKLKCGRFVQIESVWLRVHRKDAPRPSMPFGVEGDDKDPSEEEQRLFDAIKTAFFR